MKVGGIANYGGEKADRKKLLQEKPVLLSKNSFLLHQNSNFNVFKQETTGNAKIYL